MVMKHMLTTFDNPHDPFDNFSDWYTFDELSGYHTSSFLARITVTSPNLSDADALLSNEMAIDEIVRENVLGIYRKVSREVSSEDLGEETE